jgi:hypothetical protein
VTDEVPRVETERLQGRIVKFVATLLGLLVHVVLLLLVLSIQLVHLLSRYPGALVRAWLPAPKPPTDDPLHDGYFENAAANQFTRPRVIRSVQTLDDLKQAILEAESNHLRVHPIGSGHSFSDVAIADGMLIELRRMNRALGVDGIALKSGIAALLERVEAGITIRDLNHHLHRSERALTNMGGYDGQTLSGAISTGTHGSGIELGALCDMVRSVDIVSEGARVLRIEPTEGISDPKQHEQRFGAEIELRQDDDLFYAVVVALGSMGVVHSYVIEVTERYLLGEHREVLEWAVLREKLLARDFRPVRPHEHYRRAPKPIRHFEFLISPYGAPGKNRCLVTYRWKEDAQAKTQAGRSRAALATLLTGIRELDDIYALALTALPFLSPLVINWEIAGLGDKLYVAESYKVFHLGDANYVPAYSSELSFSAEPDAGAPQYVRALESLFALANEERARGRYHNVPMSVRFVAPSKHLLSLSQGRASAIVEIPLLARVPGGWDLLRFYERRLFDAFKARAHWGQANFIVASDRIFESYAEAFPRWLTQRRILCPKGTFDNSFTERMGLRSLTRGPEN